MTLPERPDGRAGPGSVRLHLVGPAGDLASDSAFAVALVGLWSRVAGIDPGSVGFGAPLVRREVSTRVAGLIEGIRRGRVLAAAATADRTLVGCALLEVGTGTSAHTGTLAVVLVEPDRRRRGVGTELMNRVLAAAGDTGIRRVSASVPAGGGLADYFARFGFVETGRRPGWIAATSDRDIDEVIMTGSVFPTGPGPTRSAGTPS